MKLKTNLLVAVIAALLTLPAHAILTITISPIADDSDHYLLQASGTGDTTTGTGVTGSLFFGSNIFKNINGTNTAGLSFGGEAISSSSPVYPSQYNMVVGSALDSGSAYSFSGDSTVVTLNGTYEGTFIVGEHTISSSSGIFGPGATGTFTVLDSPVAVPEPATTALGLGALALGAAGLRRRRKAKRVAFA